GAHKGRVGGQAGGVGGHVAAAGGGEPLGGIPAAAGAAQAGVQDLHEAGGVTGSGWLHVLHAAGDVGDGARLDVLVVERDAGQRIGAREVELLGVEEVLDLRLGGGFVLADEGQRRLHGGAFGEVVAQPLGGGESVVGTEGEVAEAALDEAFDVDLVVLHLLGGHFFADVVVVVGRLGQIKHVVGVDLLHIIRVGQDAEGPGAISAAG